jgi:hypothetical protein
VENETDFEKALELESQRKQGINVPPRTRCPSYHLYRERTKYADHAQRYLQYFGPENVLIISNEEFKEDNKAVYQEILRFLGVDADIVPDFNNVHGSKSPRFSWLNKLIHTMWLKKNLYRVLGPTLYTKIHKQVNKLLLKPSPRISMDTRLYNQLFNETAEEVEKLDTITQKNFSKIWGYKDANKKKISC